MNLQILTCVLSIAVVALAGQRSLSRADIGREFFRLPTSKTFPARAQHTKDIQRTRAAAVTAPEATAAIRLTAASAVKAPAADPEAADALTTNLEATDAVATVSVATAPAIAPVATVSVTAAPATAASTASPARSAPARAASVAAAAASGSRVKIPPLDVEAAEKISELFSTLSEALTDTRGTPIQRISKVSLSFLPLSRSVVELRGKHNKNYDTEYYLEQQEVAERFVPAFLNSLANFIDDLPPPATVAPVVIPPIPTFDSEFVPDSTIPGIRVPATAFVPEIVIPEIKIQQEKKK
ncbi:uncharacterized protein C11orf24-like [Cherax quadricarinatus]|uniref:uncharacterized protein C11orf24-like n=1 Tax=Cherax quadricarinatus TaxID=27406 RepID=UPI00387E685E